MAAEVERYIIELGTEGRLIEMQLEETVVGVMADRAALVRDYRDGRLGGQRSTRRSPSSRRFRTRTARLRPPRRALGYDRKTNTLDSRSRRAAIVRWAGSRACRDSSPRRSSIASAASRTILGACDAELAAVDGVGESPRKEIREGLRRLQEVDIVDRYSAELTAAPAAVPT